MAMCTHKTMVKKLKYTQEEYDFIRHSNLIEGVTAESEIQQSLKAWLHIKTLKNVIPKDVLRLHKIVMQKLRPDIAGKLRTCDVYIGREHKRFIGKDILEYQLLTSLTAIWLSFGLKGSKDIICRDCHVMFEKVHPFEDGNGRVGRMLYNWHRLQLGLPLDIIEYDKRQAYYSWFDQKTLQ